MCLIQCTHGEDDVYEVWTEEMRQTGGDSVQSCQGADQYQFMAATKCT